MTITTRRTPALLTTAGEIVELETAAITADEAGLLLPRVRAGLAAIRRYEGFLADAIASEMRARGQRERRAGDVVYELKADADWVVEDADAMAVRLEVAAITGDITADERKKAHQVMVSHRFDHRALNVLAKRVPEIDLLRRRIEGEPRLRTK